MSKNNSGLTLIEVLVAMALLSLIGLGILSLQYILGQNQVAIINSYKSTDEANLSVTGFVREIRSARASDNGAYPLEIVNDNEIVFYSDGDYDGITERLHYYLSGNNFIKGIIKPEGYPVLYPPNQEKITVLSENVRNAGVPIFYYYNEDWPDDIINNPLSQNSRLANTKMVRIYLRLNTQHNLPDKDYVLESFAQLRMLKGNL